MVSKSRFGRSSRVAALSLAFGLLAGRCAIADDAPASSATDILSLLDQEKPDPAAVAKREVAANAPIANNLPRNQPA